MLVFNICEKIKKRLFLRVGYLFTEICIVLRSFAFEFYGYADGFEVIGIALRSLGRLLRRILQDALNNRIFNFEGNRVGPLLVLFPVACSCFSLS